VRDGIKRNVTHQIEKALKHLGPGKNAHDRNASGDEADPNEVRKCFKKVRAALRLVREDLGDELYREENLCFRDAARLVREVRDAKMLVETVDKFPPQQLAQPIEPAALAKIRAVLLANLKDVTDQAREDKVFAAAQDAATQVRARLSDWKIERDGWAAVENGLRRTYRTGYRALALAAKTSNVKILHEWRKQARHLRNQLQLLEPAWTDREKELGDQAHQLTQLLGDDHDLAVLRETLAADPTAYGGHRVLKGLFTFIDRQRKELQQQAFAVGQKLYKDPPKTFTARMERYWRAWTGEVAAAKPSVGGRPDQERKVRSQVRSQKTKPSDTVRRGTRSSATRRAIRGK
jgi:CHAD domain-containing protein